MRQRSLVIAVTCIVTVMAVACGSGSSRVEGPADAALRRPSVSPSTSTTIRSTVYRTRSGDGAEVLAVVGDSITNEGRIEIATTFDRDREVVIDGRPGRLIGEQLTAASELDAMRPAIVIVNLGTNDAVFAHDPAESASNLRRLVGVFDAARCIVMMTVNGRLPRSGAPMRALAINETIRSIAAEDRRIRIVDLDELVLSTTSDPTFDPPFFYDDIHPTAAGQARIATAYAAAVASCPA